LGAAGACAAMARYFFNIFNDATLIDDEGLELADLAAARAMALETARELVCESVHQGHLNLDHRIEIHDGGTEPVLVVTFRDAFTIEG
jgi:uncharacterized protein DUF6894